MILDLSYWKSPDQSGSKVQSVTWGKHLSDLGSNPFSFHQNQLKIEAFDLIKFDPGSKLYKWNWIQDLAYLLSSLAQTIDYQLIILDLRSKILLI
jgi:hypothetical protein